MGRSVFGLIWVERGVITLPFHHTIRGISVVVSSAFTDKLVVFQGGISSFWGILKKKLCFIWICVRFHIIFVLSTGMRVKRVATYPTNQKP